MGACVMPGLGPGTHVFAATAVSKESTMAFAGLNYLAILAAAIGAFVFGSAYYGILGRSWMAALGVADGEAGPRMSPTPFIVAFLAELVMAWVLKLVIFQPVMVIGGEPARAQVNGHRLPASPVRCRWR